MQPFLTMRWQQPQRDAGIFVAEGEKVVRRLLESELEVVSLLLPPARQALMGEKHDASDALAIAICHAHHR